MEKPTVQLSGQDGNAFNVMGLVARALRKAGQGDKVEGFMAKAMSGDYDNVLRTAMEYCEVN